MSQTKDFHGFLHSLKDFQRDTVDYVFKRMYLDDEPSKRFLVADEVGLGKTLVAAGVIGRAIEHIHRGNPSERVDVVYICSNSTIARQNINRLNKTGQKNHRLPDRITLLPRDLRQLQSHKINFISFTPGTSFDLRSKGGRAEERALLYWLIPEDWRVNEKGALSLLTGAKTRDRFKDQVDALRRTGALDECLRRRFHEALAAPLPDGATPLKDRFLALADQLGGRATRLTDEESREQGQVVSALRGTLAAVCISSLEPDLVILDEFQRFTDLLHGDDDASMLARRLFTFPDVRVLLLSATPYRMYSTADADDKERNAHYEDLIKTVGFLQDEPGRTEAFERALAGYREAIFGLGKDGGHAALAAARHEVESILRKVMVRTERLTVTVKRDGMVRSIEGVNAPLERSDVRSYLAMQKVARAVGYGDITEFWKSAPYLLNFMKDYDLKHHFKECAEDLKRAANLTTALDGGQEALLSREDWLAYRRIDPGNARLRAFADDVLNTGAWRLLWLPPALPYYQPTGDYAAPGVQSATKRLVFSSWQVVPTAVASWLTYEVERRMLGIPDDGQPDSNSQEARKKRRGLLRFSIAEGRPTGMPVLALMYPSKVLAEIGDPMRARTDTGNLMSLAGLLGEVKTAVDALLQQLPWYRPDGRGEAVDERWYWAAPLLLDLQDSPAATRSWFGQTNLAGEWAAAAGLDADGDEIEEAGDRIGWANHVEVARKWIKVDDIERRTLGTPPADLGDVLALLAVAGPAVCAARALARVSGGFARLIDLPLRNAAGKVSSGLRTLFNQATAMSLVRGAVDRGREDVPYWRLVLEHAAAGNLQSVLDEFAHVLWEDLGVPGRPAAQIQKQVAEGMQAALQLRTATLAADEVVVDERGVRLGADAMRFRTSFAIRFGGRQTDDQKAVRREGDVQRAFNSPFWPFVLCSTSVGQEGLDFHRYCHAIVHWNLPSNPVDLEQREGRIHRFKGHAVRKNVAVDHGAGVRYQTTGVDADPWMQLFHLAREGRADKSSDLVPFWVYAREGGAAIERHMPMVGLSKDSDRATALRRSLAVYRMAFGQSRQDDLVQYLLTHLTKEQVDHAVEEARINLSPEPSAHRHLSGRAQEAGELAEEDDEQAVGTGLALSLSELEALLDQFSAMRPPPVSRSPETLGDLLDEFLRLTAR